MKWKDPVIKVFFKKPLRELSTFHSTNIYWAHLSVRAPPRDSKTRHTSFIDCTWLYCASQVLLFFFLNKLKGRPPPVKSTTHFIVTLALLWWSGTEPAVSVRHARICMRHSSCLLLLTYVGGIHCRSGKEIKQVVFKI